MKAQSGIPRAASGSMTWKRLVVLAAIGALGLAAGTGYWMIRRGFSAHGDPSAVERILARAARNLAVPAYYKTLKNPVPATPENLQAGLEHFADHCAVCHANNGSGDTQFGKNMYPHTPDMRGAQTQGMTDGEMYHTIQNGIRLSGMPAFGELSRTDDADTWKLVLFLRHLPTLRPGEEKQMERLNPKSAAEREEETEEEEFLKGDGSKTEKSRPHH